MRTKNKGAYYSDRATEFLKIAKENKHVATLRRNGDVIVLQCLGCHMRAIVEVSGKRKLQYKGWGSLFRYVCDCPEVGLSRFQAIFGADPEIGIQEEDSNSFDAKGTSPVEETAPEL